MSKKGLGQIFAIATLGGLVAAGISYFLQYKAFHRELEEEFHNFEEEEQKEERIRPDRNYVALNANRDEFVVAAKETANAAKGMAVAAKGIIKDVGNILKDQASGLKSVAVDSAEALKDKAEKRKKREIQKVEEDLDIFEETSDESAPEVFDAASDKSDSETLEATSDESGSETFVLDAEFIPTTEITDITEESTIPNLKVEEEVPQDVQIKDDRLKSFESTVIDLSVRKNDEE